MSTELVSGPALVSFDDEGNLLIPAGTDMERAHQMYKMLDNISGAAMRGKLALVSYVYHMAWQAVVNGPNTHHYPAEAIRRQAAAAGTKAVEDITGKQTYANRLTSIALRTEEAQRVAATIAVTQHYEIPSLGAWQTIASLPPPEQIEVITEAAENGYDSLQIEALIKGRSRQDVTLEDAFRQLQRCWDILKGHPRWASKAKEIINGR